MRCFILHERAVFTALLDTDFPEGRRGESRLNRGLCALSASILLELDTTATGLKTLGEICLLRCHVCCLAWKQIGHTETAALVVQRRLQYSDAICAAIGLRRAAGCVQDRIVHCLLFHGMSSVTCALLSVSGIRGGRPEKFPGF